MSKQFMPPEETMLDGPFEEHPEIPRTVLRNLTAAQQERARVLYETLLNPLTAHEYICTIGSFYGAILFMLGFAIVTAKWRGILNMWDFASPNPNVQIFLLSVTLVILALIGWYFGKRIAEYDPRFDSRRKKNELISRIEECGEDSVILHRVLVADYRPSYRRILKQAQKEIIAREDVAA